LANELIQKNKNIISWFWMFKLIIK
jgi:hypothetical protein